jgi:voltage-gated potassium channel
MVSQMIRPTVVTFLDTMLKSREEGLRVEEVEIAPGSPFAGKTVGGSGIREKTRALLVAIRHGSATDYDFNPQDNAMIGERDVLIFISAPESLREIAEISGRSL